MTNHLTTKLTNQNHDYRHKYHHPLMKTLHLTLKMTTVNAQVVETSCQSPTTVFLKTKSHPDDIAPDKQFIIMLYLLLL